LADKPHRNLGAIYTPPDFAQFLASCAIQDYRQKALDIGVGEGIFTLALFQRLRELGASKREAQRQIFGAEIDGPTYQRFLAGSQEQKLIFPNILPGDFFDLSFPQVDAVAGNPPYVRRAYLNDNAVGEIRQSVLDTNLQIQESSLTGLTDLYVYFLLRAISFLKPGGRLAVITADSWLNTVYGAALREYLCEQFLVERLISLDRKVFEDASVKPVLLVATKRPNMNSTKSVEFIRLKNGLPINGLKLLLDNPNKKKPDDVIVTKVKRRDLSGVETWGAYFKAPDVCQEIASHDLMAPIEDLAKTRIGIQTLAKDFFVLPSERAHKLQLESLFLEPIAQSTRCFNEPIIKAGTDPYWSMLIERLQR
jgi:tRNA1(Val) A37 N6-methylase TrmN6